MSEIVSFSVFPNTVAYENTQSIFVAYMFFCNAQTVFIHKTPSDDAFINIYRTKYENEVQNSNTNCTFFMSLADTTLSSNVIFLEIVQKMDYPKC